MKREDYLKLRIKTRLQPYFYGIGQFEEFDHYEIEYKIEEDQIGWFRRTFLNPWRSLNGFNCFDYDTLKFDEECKDIYSDFKEKLKTISDVYEYEDKEFERYMNYVKSRKESLVDRFKTIY